MKHGTPLAIALALLSIPAAAQNPYGIQVALTGRYPTEYLSKHYEDARRLVGEWGHVRVGADLDTPGEHGALGTAIACRAKHLIPIFTQQSSPEVPGDDPFKLNPDGTYDEQARKFERWARALYDAGFIVPYYEVGNEPQGRIPPEVHARWCISVARALHRVDPNIKVSPAGMAGPGHDYYREMLAAVPELKDHMAVWSCHPYAANRPPQYDDDDLTIQGYKWTIRALEESGVPQPKIICTETGWELGTQGDKRFPYVTEALRAQYIVEAFTRYWAPDPHIVAVTPFMLQSVPWTGWETWDFLREDGSYTPMYDALAAVPKPAGRDYQPAGTAALRGRVLDSEHGLGIGHCFVWIAPRRGVGAYAAETDTEGHYAIENVPQGEYVVSAMKRDYVDAGRLPVALRDGRTAEQDISLRRVGMYAGSFDSPEGNGINSSSFQAWDPDPALCRWDGDVGHKSKGSLRITARPGAEPGYWVATDYCAALPGERYALEAWVKTEDFVPGPDGGIRVALESANGLMLVQETAWAPGWAAGTHDWAPINVTVYAPEKSRRHRIVLSAKGLSGRVWFDDVFAGKAELPLPSAVALWRHEGPTGTLSGRVSTVDESLLHQATVYLTPGNFNAGTDRVGRYTINEVPPGTYQVSAGHQLWGSTHVVGITVVAGTTTSLDLVLPDPDLPDELVNADMEQYGLEASAMVGWKPFGIISGDGVIKSGWMKGRADKDHPGFMAHSGEGLLGYVSEYNTKTGCSYQTVRAEPDALYELSAWSMTCRRGGVRGDVANRIGIDPMGLDDPRSPYIIWTPFRPSPDTWSQLTLRARANRDRITILLGHQMISGIQWSGNFFDDVTLEQVGPPDKSSDLGATQGAGDAHLPYGF